MFNIWFLNHGEKKWMRTAAELDFKLNEVYEEEFMVLELQCQDFYFL